MSPYDCLDISLIQWTVPGTCISRADPHHRHRLLAKIEEVSGFNPVDDVEVFRPEHFTLPAYFLLAGLSAASLIFLAEIVFNKVKK